MQREKSLPTPHHILMSWDPAAQLWFTPELVAGAPVKRVRELLGGRWTRSIGDLQQDLAAAFWNASNGRKVFVLQVPAGITPEGAMRVLEARAAEEQ